MAVTKEGNQIKGSCETRGREGTIECLSVSHGVFMPYDPAKAQAGGRSSHGPVVINKKLDKSSPALYQSLLKGERLSEAKITWYGRAKEGGEEPIFIQTLTNALVVSVRPNAASGSFHEEISLAYEKVSWTYQDGGISAAHSVVGDGE
jgi:type VI secretion system secreted protein Hcp